MRAQIGFGRVGKSWAGCARRASTSVAGVRGGDRKQPPRASSPPASSPASPSVVRRALTPCTPTTLSELVKHLLENTLLHEPGKFVMVNKPYGISCLGYKQPGGGIFPQSRWDRRVEKGAGNDEDSRRSTSSTVTIEAAIPFLADYFRESQLRFFTGIKRYLSGPIVLPANEAEAEKLRHSIRYGCRGAFDDGGAPYRALAICVGRPVESEGDCVGYATFQTVGDHQEYVFVRDGKVKKRAQAGRFAVTGGIRYRVLESRHDCSLIDVATAKFSRHLPRLMLTDLGCPILGDAMYQRRVTRIENRPVLIQPKDAKRIGAKQQYVPIALLRRLGITVAEYHSRLPMFMHVYQTLFPFYEGGGQRKNEMPKGERVDVIASSPFPDHFAAMLEALEFSDAAEWHLRELSEEITCEAETNRSPSSQETTF